MGKAIEVRVGAVLRVERVKCDVPFLCSIFGNRPVAKKNRGMGLPFGGGKGKPEEDPGGQAGVGLY
jgi:hypothetical protein